MIHSSTVHKHQLPAFIDGFYQPGKPCWRITGLVGHLGCTNQNWWGTKLLPMSILWFAVCVHPCHLLRAQHYCLCPNGKMGMPLACPLTQPSYMTPMILQGLIKIQQWILCSRVSYETLTIRLLYLYIKSGMLPCSTGEPQLLQHFKMIFLKIQNVTTWLVLVNPVTCVHELS